MTGSSSPNILIIDNYDSFVYNLVQYLGGLGARVEVFRNDRIDIESVLAKRPDGILLSPGPGHPKNPRDFGVCQAILQDPRVTTPVLGVCLGHQGLGLIAGAEVVRAARILHGKPSPIHHDGKGIFRDLPNPFSAGRYHSLLVKEETLPEVLEVSAWTEEREIMGLRHRNRPFSGVQFHPESILTPDGLRILANWLESLADA